MRAIHRPVIPCPETGLRPCFPAKRSANVLGASLNGGFGKAFNLAPDDLVCPAAVSRDLAKREQEVLDDLNENGKNEIAAHAATAERILGRQWKIARLDSDGIDLADGNDIVRLPFPAPCSTLQAVFTELSKITV